MTLQYAALSSAALRGRRRRRMRALAEGLVFASPFLIGLIVFWVAPMLFSVGLIFMRWDLLSPPTFVGLDNLAKMADDPLVGLSLFNTAFYTFLGVPIHLGIALYRTIFYLPSVTPAVASAVIWIQILHNDYGILNAALAGLGLSGLKWLTDPAIAKPAFILMSAWTIGPQMVIFLAGLQSVPEALHEAAAIDGANVLQRFWSVTVPLLSPVVFFNLVIGIIGSFLVFTAAFIMTGGGPANATPADIKGGAVGLHQGNIAMYHTGPWYLPRLWGKDAAKSGGVRFDVSLNPVGKSSKAAHFTDMSNEQLNAKSKNKDEAWLLMKWIGSEDGQKRVVEGGRMPATPDMTKRLWVERAKKDYNFENAQVFLDAYETGVIPMVGGVTVDQLNQKAFRPAIDAMANGTAAKDAMAECQKNAQKMLDDFWASEKK
jgi:multiple sugar transport system permease protein